MNEHESASTSLKVILLVFAIVVIGALGYLIGVNNSSEETTDYSAPQVLKETAQETATETEEVEDPMAKCTEPSSSEKTYESANIGFCFTYPNSWTVKDGKGSGGDPRAWYVSVTDKIIPDSDYPGKVSFGIYSAIKDLDSEKTGATTLEGYLDAAAKLDDPSYTDVTATTVGGKSGFTANSGPNSFGGGTFYFATLTDGSVMEIRLYSDEADTSNVLKSLVITK